MQTGVIDALQRKYMLTKPEVSWETHTDFQHRYQDCLGSGLEAVGMENLMGIFGILFLGLVSSVLLIITENLARLIFCSEGH